MSAQPAPPDQFNRLLAALAYPIWVIALVILLTDLKKDPFMRHHASLALAWFIAWGVIYVAMVVVAFLPFLHWVALFFPLLFPAFFVLSIYYAVQTYTGKPFTIPIVSDWAKKYSR